MMRPGPGLTQAAGDSAVSATGLRAFPFAALALVSVAGFRDFATAGMEYSLVFLLLTLLIRGLETTRLSDRPFAFASGFALLYLCRPELGLLVAYYSLWILVGVLRPHESGFAQRLVNSWRDWSGTLRPLLLWAAGILLFAGSYHLFRALYYGDLFPNTYYAKSGLSSYYVQGIRYVLNALWWGPGVALIGLAVFGLPLVPRFRALLASFSRSGYLSYARELGGVALLVFYVVRVGGDFMAFRFLLPELTILALLADRYFRAEPELPARILEWFSGWIFAQRLFPESLRKKLQFSQNPAAAHWILLFICVLFLLRPLPLAQGSISDERQFFVKDISGGLPALLTGQDHPWGQRGLEFRRMQTCLQLDDFWITNSQAQAGCMKGIGLGYFGVAAGPGVRILDEQALPNRDVAELPVLVRWRPGHEHYLDLDNVLRREPRFCGTGEAAYDRVMATGMGVIIDWRPEVLATLPNIVERLDRVAELRAAGSPIVARLEERSVQRRGLDLATLRARAKLWARDATLRERSQCWQRYGAGPDSFFF